MKTSGIFKSILIAVILMMAVGCTKRVPVGYVGMVQKRSGITGTPLAPGNHACWGFDRMLLIEVSENVASENMKILCSDDLNFSFDLKLRTQVKATDGEAIKKILANQGSKLVADGGYYKLPTGVLYNTYVSPQARSIARGVVSKYQTTQIRGEREKIEKSIKDKLIASLQGTPMAVNMVATSNFDYPEVITKSMEKKRKREIEIEEEKASQAVELLKADNRLKIAQKMRTVRAAEAQAEAAYTKIIGSSLTSNYLKLRDIEARKVLYEKVAQGDKVIVGGDGVIPMVGK